MKEKIKIKDIVADLTYEEIKKRRWRHPRIWKKETKIIFRNYIISEDGIILRITNGRGDAFPGKKLNTSSVGKHGYIQISLFSNGIRYKNMLLHSLMYQTWNGKIDKNKEINHKDGKKLNNLASNLEQLTRAENNIHAIKMGLNWTEKHRRERSKKYSGSGNPNFGNKMRKESRKILSEIAKNRIGEKNGFFGKKHSEESKAKMRETWRKRRSDNVI